MKSMQNSPLCTQVEKPGGYAVESKDEITHQLKVNTSRLNGSDQHVNDDGRSRSYLSTYSWIPYSGLEAVSLNSRAVLPSLGAQSLSPGRDYGGVCREG